MDHKQKKHLLRVLITSIQLPTAVGNYSRSFRHSNHSLQRKKKKKKKCQKKEIQGKELIQDLHGNCDLVLCQYAIPSYE